MTDPANPIDLLFLGSGNAFGAQGRAFSCFLLNGRYLFDCGPTLLPQLHRAGVSTEAIDAVLISHFHADHFLGLPFLLLDARYGGRQKDLWIVGPPGVEAMTRRLLAISNPDLLAEGAITFPCRYVEVGDGLGTEVAGLALSAAIVQHVDDMQCFAFRVQLGTRSLVYSGDTTLCDGLLRLVPDADVLVLECSCAGVAVHLSPDSLAEVVRHAPPGTQVVVTHLDGHDHPQSFAGLHVAADLARFRF